MKQSYACAAFPAAPPPGRVRLVGGLQAGRKRKVDTEGKEALPRKSLLPPEPAPGSAGVCSWRDGFKVTPRSWSAGRAGPEGPRSQWSLRGALCGVWRYLACRERRGPAPLPSRGGVKAARSGGLRPLSSSGHQ